MMLTMARCKHPLALPAVLAAIVLAFHAALWGLGVSLEQAQDAGWVLKPAVSWFGGQMVDQPGWAAAVPARLTQAAAPDSSPLPRCAG